MSLINKILQETVGESLRIVEWPTNYVNSRTGKIYRPHNDQEVKFVYDDTPPYSLLKSGEGAGKSVALIIKILNRLRRGCSGAVISPNMPSFRRSLFPEIINWLPRQIVIDSHQRFFLPGWRPRESFVIVVHNELGGYSELLCASAESPRLLEGPNLNFVAMDEIRGMKDSEIMKVLSGRVRVFGPNNEPPQLFCSSTPSLGWMHDFFGPLDEENDSEEIKSFKRKSYVATISVEENIQMGNLPEDFIETRGATLTAAEKLVRISGEWVNEDNPEKFLPDMIHWDTLIDPKLGPARTKGDSSRNWSDAMVLAIDASVNRDTTAIIGVTRHPVNRDHTCVRLVKVYDPKGSIIDFAAVEDFIKQVSKKFHVVMLVYDSFQMEHMAQSLYRGGVVYTKRFNQQNPRTLADQYLFDSILTGTIRHMGDLTLRKHLDNCNVKIAEDLHKKRIMKRSDSLKIDAAVALSMANYECKRLNI